MARYIDVDAFLEKMKKTDRYFDVKFDIEEMPTADVVPKSEVAVEVIEEAFKMMEDNFVNTPIYKVFPHRLKAELKKKYT